MNNASSGKKPEENKSGRSKDSKSSINLKSSENKKDPVKDEEGVLVDAARKIETGAKKISEKATDVVEKVSDQTTEVAEIVYDKVSKSVSDAYQASAKTMSDVSKKAGKYIKKYENTFEIKKLSNERDIKMQELGTHIFNLYKSKSLAVDKLVADDESLRLINNLVSLNKEIVTMGRKIKKKI
jgi:hypothetical protein